MRAPLRAGALLSLLALAALAISTGARSAQASDSVEAQIKAAYVFKFLSYVEWPQEAMEANDRRIAVCVLGRNGLATSLDDLEGRRVSDNVVTIKHLTRVEELNGCHVMVVSGAQAARLRRILERVRGRSVLTVGEPKDFARAGGIIGFVIQDDTVRFEINVDAAERSQLRISSRLLRVAHVVRDADTGNGDR